METNSPKPPKEGLEIGATGAAAATSASENPISTPKSNEELSIREELTAFAGWCGKNPLAIALFTGFIGFFVWLYGFRDLFLNETASVTQWLWFWTLDGEQEHGRMVPFIALGLIWMARHRLREAAGKGNNWGLLGVGFGVLLFIFSVRSLQPRIALAALPFFLLGTASFLWGNRVARLLLFPACFLFFMIPVAAISQATFDLQFLITESVGLITRFFGIGVQAMGTTLTATDGTFNFEIAEGCSGIRSLAAMTMLTAVYVHLTQNRLWKKVVIFGASLLFAVVGNIGRIMGIVLAARYYDPEFAAGIMHDYSGYVFFPVAVIAMLVFAKLVNWAGDFVERRLGGEAAVAGGAQ